ncbi:MAG: PIN domain-containing protein [Thermodesulfovibrionales bacterium]
MEQQGQVLIDTSSWIEALRVHGNPDVRNRVFSFMIEGRAAWCDMVALELWSGAQGDYEKKKLRELEKEILCLQTGPEVWQLAKTLAQECRKSGRTVPTADLIIAACALYNHAAIEHSDDRIDRILKIHAAAKRKS